MPLCQVYHMDIIPDAGAVRRGIIVAEYPQAGQLAHCHLGNVGYQIVGDAVGILPDEPAGMRPDGVEVPECHHAPFRIRNHQIPQELLDHHLGVAVRVGGGGGHVLSVGHRVMYPVYGGRGGEYQLLAAILPHSLEQQQGAGQIVVIILQGLGNGFSHCLQSGKVDHSVDAVIGKNLLHARKIQHIRPIEGDGFAGDLPDPVYAFLFGIGQVVHDDDFIAAFQQLYTAVAADESGAAGY